MNKKIALIIIVIVVALCVVGYIVMTSGTVEEVQEESQFSESSAEPQQEKGNEDEMQDKSASAAVSKITEGFKAKQVMFEEQNPEYPDAEKIIYEINPDRSSSPEMHPADAQLWSMVEALAPTKEVFERLKTFEVYYDEEDTTLAAVESLDDTNNTWLFSINYIAVDEFSDLAPTIVHEYAHILSLQDSQTTTEAEQAGVRDACENYLVAEGCLNADAYLDDFFEQYWEGKEVYIGERDRTEEETEEFFEKNSDDFVSAYATTNPAEDFAESFMSYALKESGSNETVKEQKKSFFQSFDALQTYRTNLHTTISAWAS